MTKCRRADCILPLGGGGGGGGGGGVGSGSCQHLSRLPERRLGGGMVPVVNLRPQQRTPHTPASHRVPNTNNPLRSTAVGLARGADRLDAFIVKENLTAPSRRGEQRLYLLLGDDVNHKLFWLICNKCVFAATSARITSDELHSSFFRQERRV